VFLLLFRKINKIKILESTKVKKKEESGEKLRNITKKERLFFNV
jgi:hypothetical protein